MTSRAGTWRVSSSGPPLVERGTQRMALFPTISSSTGEPATASVEDISQMTVRPGATNAGATRPSNSKPATTAPTVCTHPEPLA
jgi:hypothetical protein